MSNNEMLLLVYLLGATGASLAMLRAYQDEANPDVTDRLSFALGVVFWPIIFVAMTYDNWLQD